MSHFARVPDPGIYRRVLDKEQAKRVVRMRDDGLSWTAIAAWFQRNGTQISHQAVKYTYDRQRAA